MLRTDTQTFRFINENLMADPAKLLLSAKKHPELDMQFIADQILSRRQIREKLPEWYAQEQIIIPSRIAAEQCSSFQTAAYKQRLIKGETVCDLTGGLGVDTFYISKVTRKSFYIERFEAYCEAARHNFGVLGANHIEVMHGDSREIGIPDVDTIYLDPARRGDANKRLFDLHDCEPDIVSLKGDLLKNAMRVIVKISPMADITRTLSLLPETTQIHVLSVKNECKELLFVLDRVAEDKPEPVIYCINYTSDGNEASFQFTTEEEQSGLPEYASEMGAYLYEPNASILKAGAFRSIALRFGLKKLQVNSHLYTSDEMISDFPGRIFKVEEVFEFTSKLSKKLAGEIPKANITVRNFPLSVDELRKKTKIKEGGEVYLFATTLGKETKLLIRCSKSDKK
ncbi:MAG: SAM-dependent methyltransferase [Bacteroidales bacterium]